MVNVRDYRASKPLEDLVAMQPARRQLQGRCGLGYLLYTPNTGRDIHTEWMYAVWFMPGLLVIIDNIRQVICKFNIILRH